MEPQSSKSKPRQCWRQKGRTLPTHSKGLGVGSPNGVSPEVYVKTSPEEATPLKPRNSTGKWQPAPKAEESQPPAGGETKWFSPITGFEAAWTAACPKYELPPKGVRTYAELALHCQKTGNHPGVCVLEDGVVTEVIASTWPAKYWRKRSLLALDREQWMAISRPGPGGAVFPAESGTPREDEASSSAQVPAPATRVVLSSGATSTASEVSCQAGWNGESGYEDCPTLQRLLALQDVSNLQGLGWLGEFVSEAKQAFAVPRSDVFQGIERRTLKPAVKQEKDEEDEARRVWPLFVDPVVKDCVVERCLPSCEGTRGDWDWSLVEKEAEGFQFIGDDQNEREAILEALVKAERGFGFDPPPFVNTKVVHDWYGAKGATGPRCPHRRKDHLKWWTQAHMWLGLGFGQASLVEARPGVLEKAPLTGDTILYRRVNQAIESCGDIGSV